MTPSTSSPAGEANSNRPTQLPSLHPAPERTDTDGRMPSSSVRSGGLPYQDPFYESVELMSSAAIEGRIQGFLDLYRDGEPGPFTRRMFASRQSRDEVSQ